MCMYPCAGVFDPATEYGDANANERDRNRSTEYITKSNSTNKHFSFWLTLLVYFRPSLAPFHTTEVAPLFGINSSTVEPVMILLLAMLVVAVHSN